MSSSRGSVPGEEGQHRGYVQEVQLQGYTRASGTSSPVGPGANTGTAATATTLSPGFSVTASMSVQVGIQGASSQLALAEGSTTRNDRERAKQAAWFFNGREQGL